MVAIHTRPPALILKAGQDALTHLRERGLNASDVSLLPGAAGGPKGIGISGLDKAVFGQFLPQARRTRTLVGASVGCWRFAAVAAGHNQPQQVVARLERLADLYTRQRFPKGMTIAQITRQCEQMIRDVITQQEQPLLTNSDYQLVVVADRCRHLFASDRLWALILSLLGIAASNAVSRNSLRLFMQRTLFYTGSNPPPIRHSARFTTFAVPLNQQNLYPALMASASIPGVLAGVRNITGAPHGTYRDGGLLDYHLDLPWQTDGLVLYPHFSERITPGWFDKPWKWRNASPKRQRQTLLIAPSADYLARLPYGKLPSRDDFKRFAGDDAAREAYWKKAIAESDRLGEEFLELVATGRIAQHVKPLV